MAPETGVFWVEREDAQHGDELLAINNNTNSARRVIQSESAAEIANRNQSTAGHILLVERSATLRHIMQAWLLRQGEMITVASSYPSAVTKLQRSRTSRDKFDSIILGWPSDGDSSNDNLFATLKQSVFQDLPLIVMSQEESTDIAAWLETRSRAENLLWDNYTEIQDVLSRITGKIFAVSEHPTTRQDAPGEINVLLVDDSPSVRRYYSNLLNAHGYKTETAYSVKEGMALALRKPFDLAVIDYFMGGVNGDVLCQKLRDNPKTRGITSTILTATYVETVITDALEAGAAECMFKDETNELFLARIKSLAQMILAQKSIDRERKRLDGILTSVGDGVYGVDAKGHISFINPAGIRLLRLDPKKPPTGKIAFELFHYADSDFKKVDRKSCYLHQAYGTNTKINAYETVFWRSDGSPIPVECTIYPLKINEVEVGSVVAFRDISERRSLEELRWQATHDPLTELVNRRSFEEILEDELHRIKRSNETSALLYIDLDRFKFVNDTAGHAAGDSVLIEAARKLRSRLRESDILSRIGGDEFTALLRNIDTENIFYVANSFREVLSQSAFVHNSKKFRINGSVGVAIISPATQSIEEAMENANIACHMAKRKGRNQTYVYVPDSDAKTADTFETGWSARLREALKNNQFLLCFQPIVKLANIDIDNLPDDAEKMWDYLQEPFSKNPFYETLIRLRGPDNEIIPPNAFLSSAERFDLMQEIDLWVISSVIKRIINDEQSNARTTYSVNLSSRTLEDENILQLLKSLLSSINLGDSYLIFEVTETSAITNIDAAQHFITELKKLGCKFALDDFGTGFSSFSYLKHLPVDFIKIDGQFVQNMHKDTIDSTMVTSMNDIAHSLGMRTIAEYVENVETIRLLSQSGVDYIQGNIVSTPICDLPEVTGED